MTIPFPAEEEPALSLDYFAQRSGQGLGPGRSDFAPTVSCILYTEYRYQTFPENCLSQSILAVNCITTNSVAIQQMVIASPV